MNIYENQNISKLIAGNTYVGRGIVIGKTQDSKHACIAYFIMGRSENSRNRILVERENSVFTEPFDPNLVEDPSLIIYPAIKVLGNTIIVTNGDQTQTIYAMMQEGSSFLEALKTREFEPDAPNFTPRISGLVTFAENDFTYEMSILKSADAEGTACNRYTFSYAALAGVGHFIHTYMHDGNPIPTFQGEPERVIISNSIDDFTNELWQALDSENKIALYTRYIDLESGAEEKRIINKNKVEG